MGIVLPLDIYRVGRSIDLDGAGLDIRRDVGGREETLVGRFVNARRALASVA